MKKFFWMIGVWLFLGFIATGDAFCMGWFQPPSPSPVDPGPVSAPEPGIIALVGMAASAGVGYFFGRRKK